MLGKIQAPDYAGFIREITAAKMAQSLEDVRTDCFTAAAENRATGVGWIGEHSDRPFAGEALSMLEIGGVIFQETITFFERESREQKLHLVRERAAAQAAVFGGEVYVSPHAFQTVDTLTLAEFGASKLPFSMHVAETASETLLTRDGAGPIADFYRANGFAVPVSGKSLVPTLADLGLVRRGAQFVHCCALEPGDIELLASAGVGVAHCPRSNIRLQCPIAPVREMIDAGIRVGLGMDSAASGGPIDMFAEMRAALATSLDRGRPVTAEEVWRMATSEGFFSFGPAEGGQWDVVVGGNTPLLKIHVEDAQSVEDLVDRGSPEAVEWV